MRAIQADIVPWGLRGKLFGTIQAFFNAGATIGPLVGGVIYAYFSLLTFNLGFAIVEGFMVPFWLAAGLGLIGAFLVWKYIEETSPVQVLVEAQSDVSDAT
jgi:MFS family permease